MVPSQHCFSHIKLMNDDTERLSAMEPSLRCCRIQTSTTHINCSERTPKSSGLVYQITIFCYKTSFPFQNDLKSLDLTSYKMDLDLWDSFGRGKKHFIAEQHKTNFFGYYFG